MVASELEEEALERAGVTVGGGGVGGEGEGEGGEEASVVELPEADEFVVPPSTATGGSVGHAAAAAASEGSATRVESVQAFPLSSTEVGAPGKTAEEEDAAAAAAAASCAPTASFSVDSSRIMPNDAEPPLGGIACQYPGAWPVSSWEPLEASTLAFSRFHDCSTEA